METTKITLNRDRAQTVLHAVQGEANAQTFAFSLTDSRGAAVELTADMSAAFYVDKNDGNPVQLSATVNTDTQTVDVPLTVQATTAAGNQACLLQVYTDDEDIWRSDVTLSVSANPANKIPSRAEFSELTQILQNADTAAALAEYYGQVSETFNEVLYAYTEGISPYQSGSAPVPNEQAYYNSAIAYDTNGNLLLLDTYSYGCVNTMLSVNNGISWLNTPLSGSSNAAFSHCIGGDKFLMLGRTHMMWAQVNGETLSHGTPLENPFKSRSTQIRSGKYAGGKYWVFYHNPSSGSPYAPCYFTGDGTTCKEVTLPDSKMVAHDIVFDYENAVYYMTGGYDAFTEDEQACTSWIIKSTDLENWETVYSRAFDIYSDCFINTFGGYVIMLRGNAKVRIILATGEIRTTTTDFTPTGLVATQFGLIAASSDMIYFSKATGKFVSDALPISAGVGRLAAYGRYAAVCEDNSFAVYRVDLAGEKLIGEIENAEQLLAELQVAAGRKIICTDTDPGLGAESSETEGTLIMVFSAEAEADT